MSTLCSDVPKLLHLTHSLASSADGAPAVSSTAGDDESAKPTHGVLHVTYAASQGGRDDVLPMHERKALVLSRGQVESLTTQLYRMLERVGDGSGGAGN